MSIPAQFWKLNSLDNTLESKNGELFFFFANILQITPLNADAELYVIENVDNTTQVLGLENDETAKGILLKFLGARNWRQQPHKPVILIFLSSIISTFCANSQLCSCEGIYKLSGSRQIVIKLYNLPFIVQPMALKAISVLLLPRSQVYSRDSTLNSFLTYLL
jgi:hypothetical protein